MGQGPVLLIAAHPLVVGLLMGRVVALHNFTWSACCGPADGPISVVLMYGVAWVSVACGLLVGLDRGRFGASGRIHLW